MKLGRLAEELYEGFYFDRWTSIFFASGGDKSSNGIDRFINLLEDMGFDIRRYFKRLRLGGKHCHYPVWIYVLNSVNISILEHRHKYTRGIGLVVMFLEEWMHGM